MTASHGMPRPLYHLRLFGGPVLSTAEGEEVSLTPMQLALVGLVFGHEGERLSRSRIAWLLWEADDDASTRHRIRQLLYAVTKRLGGVSPFEVEGEEVRAAERGFGSDLRDAIDALDKSDPHKVVALCSEQFLAGAPKPSETFADWISARTVTVRGMLRERLAKLYEESLRQCSWNTAFAASKGMLAIDPTAEDCLRAFLRAALLAGANDEAAAAYRSFRERILGEEGEWVAPSDIEELVLKGRQPQNEPKQSSSTEPPLIGREGEIGRVMATIREAAPDTPSVVILEGEAGTGKSRILQELRRLLDVEGFIVLMAQCAEMETVIPLNPILDAMRESEGSLDLRTLPEPWRTVTSALLPEFSGSRVLPTTLPYVAPAGVPRRTFEGLRILLEAIATRGPVVLILDDFHWADASSAAALQFIVRRWEGRALVIIVAVRPEAIERGSLVSAFLSSISSCEWVLLGALDNTVGMKVIHAILGSAANQHLESEILRLAGGNALYLTEMAHEAMAGRFAVSPERELDLPDSISRLIAGRLARVSPQAHTLMRIVAVAQATTLRRLCAVSSLPEGSVVKDIEELTRARLLKLSERTVRFGHELIREYVYTSCPSAERQFWHGRVAASLATDGAPSGELAYHFAAAGDASNAFEFAAAAAQQASTTGTLPEALYFARLAAENAPNESEKVRLKGHLAHLQYVSGDFEAAAASHFSLGRQLREAGDLPAALRSDLERADALGETGRESQEICLQLLSRVSEEAYDGLGDLELYYLASELRIKFLERLGRTSEIVPILDAIRLSRGAGTAKTRCLAACTLSLSHLFSPLPGTASVAMAEDACIEASKAQDQGLSSRAFARRFLVLVNMGMLKLPRYADLIRQNLELAERSGDLKERYNAHNNTGVFLLDAGEHDSAATQFAQAQAVIRGAVSTTGYRDILCNSGELLLSSGQFEKARDTFERLRPLLDSPACRERVRRFATAGLGLAAFHCGDLRTARLCEEELGSVEEDTYYDAYPLQWFKGEMLRRRGKLREAYEILETYSASVEGRLQLSWLKTKLLQAHLLSRLNDSQQYEVAEAGRDLARNLNLRIREQEFRTHLEKGR